MMNAKRIAKMIRANVRAYYDGILTYEQFGRVAVETWRLVDRDEPCIIGSPCDRRMMEVKRELNRNA